MTMEGRSPGRGRGRGRGGPLSVKAEAEAGSSTPAPKKFEPKVVPRKAKKEVKSEDAEESKELQRLIQQSQEAANNRRARPGENKATRVAFGAGSGAVSRPVGFKRGPTDGSAATSRSSSGGASRSSDKKPVKSSEPEELFVHEAVAAKVRKPDVFEEMDDSSYKPISLPLRRPMNVGTEFSDDDLDDDEAPSFDENNAPPCAKELGLETPSSEPRLLFLQLPTMLPVAFKNLSPESNLSNFPEGLMGKLRVYESGAVKLHIGEVVMDVHPGTRCIFSQEVVAINSSTKKCALLGDVGRRLVITPDISGMLGDQP